MKIISSFLFFVILTPHTTIAQNSFSLTFNWPEKLKAQVYFIVQNYHEEDGKKKNKTVKGNYNLFVEPYEKALNISYKNFSLEEVTKTVPSTNAEVFEETMLEIFKTTPSFMVSTNGNYLHITPSQNFNDKIRTFLKQHLKKYPQEWEESLYKTFTRMDLQSIFNEHYQLSWSRNVSSWKNITLNVGSWKEKNEYIRLPSLGSVKIPLKTGYRIVEQCKCQKEEIKTICILIERKSQIAPSALPFLFGKVEKEFARRGKKDISIIDLNVIRNLELKTNPKTLQPYLVKEKKEIILSLMADGIPHKKVDREHTVIRFKYLTSEK